MIEDPNAGTEQGDTAFAARAAPGLEERTRAARVQGAGQDSNPWPRDEAGPALAPSPRALPADLAEAMRTAGTGDLRSWVEQARVQAERPLQLAAAVTRTAADRASSHRDEEALVLQGLQRQLAEAGPWWRPGTWRRRAGLKARIAARQQVLTRLSRHLRHTERQLSELLPTRQAALEAWAAKQRRVLDRAVAAVQELRRRERGLLDGHPFDPPEQLDRHAPRVWPPTKSCPTPVPAMPRRRQRVRPRNARTPTHSSPPPIRPGSRLASRCVAA